MRRLSTFGFRLRLGVALALFVAAATLGAFGLRSGGPPALRPGSVDATPHGPDFLPGLASLTNRLPAGVPLPPAARRSEAQNQTRTKSDLRSRQPESAAPASPQATQAGDWSIVDSPNSRPSPTANFPSGVTCLSASDCWMVGYYENAHVFQTLIQHWDGNAWSIVESPNTSRTQPNFLRSITCTSANDCWAAGSAYDGSYDRTLIQHWDGNAWSIVATPNSSETEYNYLQGIACASASQCWAVGSHSDNAGVQKTLILRWDGSQWTLAASPNNGTTENILSGVACAAANDCWAVGSYINNLTSAYQTLVQRWNGSTWSMVSSLNTLFPFDHQLFSVTCPSASDCWAVGRYSNGVVEQTLTERWDGSAWTVVNSPGTSPTENNRLSSVTCASTTDCWAAGRSNNGTVDQTLVERWNGFSWSVITSPNSDVTRNNSLAAVAHVPGTSNSWAIGWHDNNGVPQTLVEYWNGTTWSITAAPSLNAAQNNTLLDAACTSAADCWAVGAYFDGVVLRTMIQHWDGSAWEIVASPNTASSQDNLLYSVACLSGSDCWAIGYYAATSAYQTLTLHWDGISWDIVASPNTGPAQNNFLTSLACASSSDCWAVGFYDTGIAYQTLVEHWDGNAWSIVNSPNTNSSYENRLYSVSCTGGSDCWAVGRYFTGTALQTLIQHWNGTSWSIVASPNVNDAPENVLWGVHCAGADDCWTVGSYGYGSGTGQPLIEHWDGDAWTMVDAPQPTAAQSNYNYLRNVTCSSAANCWAVGYYFAEGADRTLVQHWNGLAWSLVASPNTSADLNNFLFGLACISPLECWAVGYSYLENGVIQTMTQRYLGSIPLDLVSVASRKIHGDAGPFDMALSNGAPSTIECRSGGPNDEHTLVFTFNQPLDAVGAATVTGAGSVVSATVGPDPHEYIVHLAGVTNGQNLTVSLTDVQSTAGGAMATASVSIAFLAGDTTGDGAVNSADISQTKSQSGTAVTSGNFRVDLNSDGAINSADISLVKSKSGTAMP